MREKGRVFFLFFFSYRLGSSDFTQFHRLHSLIQFNMEALSKFNMEALWLSFLFFRMCLAF
jgi:hypothetical protein